MSRGERARPERRPRSPGTLRDTARRIDPSDGAPEHASLGPCMLPSSLSQDVAVTLLQGDPSRSRMDPSLPTSSTVSGREGCQPPVELLEPSSSPTVAVRRHREHDISSTKRGNPRVLPSSLSQDVAVTLLQGDPSRSRMDPSLPTSSGVSGREGWPTAGGTSGIEFVPDGGGTASSRARHLLDEEGESAGAHN